MAKKLIKRLLILLNLIVTSGLILSLIAQKVSPADSWLLAVISIGFPFLLILNFLFVIFWLIAKRYWVLMSGCACIMAISTLSNYVAINASPDKWGDFKVMSYNVHLFDYYEHEEKRGRFRDSIVDLVNKTEPDVVCFQEFYSRKSRGWDNETWIRKTNKHIYLNEIGTFYNDTRWGMYTASKYPIVGTQTYYYDSAYGFATYVDIVKEADTVRIFNVHLRSFRFSNTQKQIMTDMLDGNGEVPSFEESKSILTLIKDAYSVRANQVDTILAEVRRSPYKVIVCGDFNDPPSTYTYHQFDEELVDGFKEGGSMLGRTYAGTGPAFRIDYIWHSNDIKTANFTRISKKFSDHYPVLANLKIKYDE